MDIDELKTFLEVYRTRHFGQAAENLYVSQSTVSARIRQLEQSLGVAIFTRDRNNIQLTNAGEKLLAYAESITTSWNRARFEISVEDEGQIPFIIGGAPSLWDTLLQELLYFIQDSFPDIALYAETDSPEALFKRILDNTMDLAFIFEAPQTSELDIVEIMHVPLVMVTTQPGLTIDDAFDDKYVLVDWGTSFANNHARHFKNRQSPSVRIALGRIAKEYILNRGGTAYLPEPMVSNDLEENNLFYVKDAPVIDRVAYAIFNPDNNKHDIISKTLSFFSKTTVNNIHRIQ